MAETFAHSPLLTAIAHHADATPQKVALIEGDTSVTYAELFANIVQHSRLLVGAGLKPGDRIVLSATKEAAMVYTYFAAHLLGAVNVVVDKALPDEQKAYIVATSQPKLMLGLERSVAQDFASLVATSAALPLSNRLNAGDVADIMFTTGTTGKPKGVCLSHANVAGSAQNINAFIGNNADDIEVLGLPLSHSFGLGRLRCTLLAGGTLVLLGSFANLKLFFNAIERHQATGFGMVPAVWHYIRRYSGTRISRFASQLRYIELGSAPLSVEDKRELMQLFPDTRICMHYGLTEASRAFFMEFHDNADDLSTIGSPASAAVEAIILNEAGRPAKTNEVGEICVKGNMVTQSYLNADDNRQAFTDDGFFRTGDSGYRNADGKYYLIGRVKEIVNIGGKKVSPVTIEEAIIAAGADDCAVVPISDPRGVLGEVPKAFVVTSGDLEAIKRKAADRLEPYQMPAEWVVVEKIPRTHSGKIQRNLLKE